MKRNTNAKEKSETKPKTKVKKTKKAWRFFRSNLSTIVWDANIGDDGGIMANFKEGHFTTTDKKVADILRQKGYPEIGLNDTAPPNIIINQPVHKLRDGVDVPVMSKGINENIAQARMEGITEEVKAPEIIE